MLMVLMVKNRMSPALAISAVLAVSVAIGLFHGILVTKMRLQPFIVTLCGLLLYRGIARLIADDETGGFGSTYPAFRYLAIGRPLHLPLPFLDAPLPIPMPMLILIALAVVAGLFLNFTIWGRYLLALGRNEQAARFSGINTDRMVLAAYVLCSLITGLGGVLFAAELNSIQPASLGETYELYAIAAAVLGGCSLRGGEGSILGVIIGATLMRVLYNAINILGIRTYLEPAIIGAVILIGVIVDELVKRFAARRRATRQMA
jgi:ribose transport system permease protein